jgi:hypothetical protein
LKTDNNQKFEQSPPYCLLPTSYCLKTDNNQTIEQPQFYQPIKYTFVFMREVQLNHIHVGLGAKMVPFAGFSMPVQYKGLITEHLAVRSAAGIFDVSHMGEFFVSGPKALDLIQYVTSNDASKLVDGQVQYCPMKTAAWWTICSCTDFMPRNFFWW